MVVDSRSASPADSPGRSVSTPLLALAVDWELVGEWVNEWMGLYISRLSH